MGSSLPGARSQFLIPERFLPTGGGRLIAIEVLNRSSTTTITYTSLQIVVDTLDAPSLDPVFASNLNAPTEVLNQATTVSYQPRAWSRISFTTPYDYAGQDSLVIDVRKGPCTATNSSVTMMDTTLERGELPRYLLSLQGPGSTVGTGYWPSLLMRLVFEEAATVQITAPRINLGPGDPGRIFARDSLIDFDVFGAPLQPYLLLLDLSTTLRPNATPLPPFNGEARVRVGVALTVTTGSLDAVGQASATVRIPNDPNLFGLRLAVQSLSADPRFVWPVWSNLADGIIS